MICQWTAAAVRQERFLLEHRIWKPRTRPHATDTACGLDCPEHALGRLCYPVTSAHKRFGKDKAHTVTEASVALGAALSCLHFAKKHDAPSCATRCACGMLAPSMPHILWNGVPYSDRRRMPKFVPLPIDRAEERLVVPTIAAPPAPLPATAIAPLE